MEIARGAEAVLFLEEDKVRKTRITKGYRHKNLDLSLRASRTRREAKMLSKASVPVPNVYSVDKEKMEIVMEHIEGDKLSTSLEQMDYRSVMADVGKNVSQLHAGSIIHGDLTTSNMIFADKLYLIDFGLAFTSDKAEDKAVDLHLLKQALESKHYTIAEECFSQVLKNYDDKAVIARLKKVEARGRNKLKGAS